MEARDNECFLCSHQASDLNALCAHLTAAHSWFIPYEKYCTDKEGYIRFVQFRVFSCKQCLQCHEYFDSLRSLQRHMQRKNHSIFDYNADDFSAFFDFTDMYPKEFRSEDFAKKIPMAIYTKEFMEYLVKSG